MLHSLIANGSSERTVCRISHTHWYGYPFLLFCLIANSSNGLVVCPTSHTELKSEPCLMRPPLQTFSTFLTVILHHRLRLWHRTQFCRRVSDHSVALAASCSSALCSEIDVAMSLLCLMLVTRAWVPWFQIWTYYVFMNICEFLILFCKSIVTYYVLWSGNPEVTINGTTPGDDYSLRSSCIH